MEADVLVIGAGSVGAAAAWRLSSTGLKVVCADQGDWFRNDLPEPDQPGYAEMQGRELHTNPNIRSLPADIPIDDDDSAIKPAFGNNIGGSSLYWAAHAPRFRPDDFCVRETEGTAENWPFGYTDLAPYYSLNETMSGVAYVSGDSTLPLRMPCCRQYPEMPPSTKWMAGVLKSRNWHAWPTDIVSGLPKRHCRHEGPCNVGCETRRATGADRIYISKAISNGTSVLSRTRIVLLEHDNAGRITAAVAEREGKRFAIKAQKYVLATNGLNTPHLLILSQSGKFPNGLANSSGLVGRRLMMHPYAWVDAVFADPFASPGPSETGGLISLEFRDRGSVGQNHRGARLQFAGRPSSSAAIDNLAGHLTGLQPSRETSDHIVGFSICAEDLPELSNRICLSDKRSDTDGRPVPRMIYKVSENSKTILNGAMKQVAGLFQDIGAIATHLTPLKEQAGFHIMGTAVMGRDRENSVTDQWGGCHESENLYIGDASVFVTSSVMNPTATAQAFALRQADRIASARF